MAEVNSYSPSPAAKDPKQLKKEKKEQERLQKEREKQEKKLEKEKKKREENERKQREKEAKKNAKEQSNQNGDATTDEKSAGQQTTAIGSKENSAPAASPPQSPPGADAAPETAATATAATTNGEEKQRPVPANCWPEKVKVAEPPGTISGFGEPIAIIFDATQAGEGTMSASCAGTSVGPIPVAVSEPWSGIFNVHFTPNSADVYTLNVKWGGFDITGSPYTINLSRLSDANGAAGMSQPTMQATEDKKKVVEEKESGGEGKREKEEAAGDASDDPFEMAFQASRLLGELFMHRV